MNISDTQQESESNDMNIMEHVKELRNRLIHIAISITICSILCFIWSKETFEVLKTPFTASFGDQLLIGTGPAEAFMLKLKSAIFLGVIVSSPYLFFQIWLFVVPGLYHNERRMLLPFLFASTILFLFGVSFCYMYVLPLALDFFKGEYESIGISPTIKISEYLGLLIKALLGFGLVFELPVICLLLGKLGVITDAFLIKYFRHAIVLMFLLSAFLTPPDVLSQVLMAAPLICLYAISILLVKFVQPK